ncbi:MAG TPA: beta family protein [Xanthobacteraceae bacterium]|nr:beta family protein [Xanthobacteraceae bacterium]
MRLLHNQYYSPSLREKAGELQALRRLDADSKDRLLPHLVALPLTARENQGLTIETAIKREVGKVQNSWQQRTCLWDPRYLVFNRHDAADDSRWLEQLLEGFSSYDAKIIPVIGLREKIHRASSLAKYALTTNSGVAIRIGFDDLQDHDLLKSVLTTLRIPAEECIPVLDITEADISDTKEFAKSLIGWLVNYRSIGNWPRIVLSGSSFPIKNPAPPKSATMVSRLEWQLWRSANEMDQSLRDFLFFGDFGADNSHFVFESGGRPIPHLRYATESEWLVVRGDGSDPLLRGVSKRIFDSRHFRGATFSAGDEFIALWARGSASTADPSVWRMANMNHHITTVVRAMAEMYGLKLPLRREVPLQPDLFENQETTERAL